MNTSCFLLLSSSEILIFGLNQKKNIFIHGENGLCRFCSHNQLKRKRLPIYSHKSDNVLTAFPSNVLNLQTSTGALVPLQLQHFPPFCSWFQEDTVNAPGSRLCMPNLIEELLRCRSPEAFGPLQFGFLHPKRGSAILLGRTTKVVQSFSARATFEWVPLRAMGGPRQEILLVLDLIISAALSNSRMSRVMLSRLIHCSFSRNLSFFFFFEACQNDQFQYWKLT